MVCCKKSANPQQGGRKTYVNTTSTFPIISWTTCNCWGPCTCRCQWPKYCWICGCYYYGDHCHHHHHQHYWAWDPCRDERLRDEGRREERKRRKERKRHPFAIDISPALPEGC